MAHVNPYRPHLGGDPTASAVLMLLALSAGLVIGLLFLAVP